MLLGLTQKGPPKSPLKGPIREPKRDPMKGVTLKAQRKKRLKPLSQGSTWPKKATHVGGIDYMCGHAHV